jgi:branched-chain amino acid transport system permease protein
VIVTNGYAQPGEFSILLSLEILIGAAVAGFGSLWGVLVGAAFIGLLPTVSTDVPIVGSNHGRDVVFGLIVIFVILALPNGFAGLLARLAHRRAGLD